MRSGSDGLCASQTVRLRLSENVDDPPFESLRETVIDPDRTNLLIVATGPPDAVIDSLRRGFEASPARLGIVSVGECARSAAPSSISIESDQRLPFVTVVRALEALSDLESAVQRYLDGWNDNGNETVVCIDSLSAVLEHTGLDATVPFLENLTDVILETSSTGVFRIDPSAHDLETLGTVNAAVGGPSLSMDAAFELLCASRRRILIRSLFSGDISWTIDELVARVSDAEDGSSAGADDELMARVRCSLLHVHLPKLTDVGMIEVTPDRERVRLRARAFDLLSHVP